MTTPPAAPFRLLISSAGRRGGLIACFRQAAARLSLPLIVHASDHAPDLSAACAWADRAHAVPRCHDPAFIPRMLDLVRTERIGLIIPTIDTELETYARQSAAFDRLGCRLHLSDAETIAIARDKARTAGVLAAAGINTPLTWDEVDLRANKGVNWPVFAKPRSGSASRALAVYDHLSDVPARFSEPMIFQELLTGPEYTVNIFIDREGVFRCAIPHRRLQVRAGEVEKGVTERRADITEIARKLAGALKGARGCLCFQLIDDPDRGPCVFEINARFGGGYPLADHAGAHFAEWLLRETLDLPRTADDNWRDGVLMLRYDAAVFRG